jgi:type VI secretion system secreted protein VgrG
VQYAESDYDFIHRILSEEGIHYHYATQNGQTVLVFGDSNAAFANGVAMDYLPASGLNPDKPALRECQTFWRTVSGKVSGRDFTFLRPVTPLDSEVTPPPVAQNNQTQISAKNQPSAQANPSDKLEEYRWPNLSDTEAENLRQNKLALARHMQAAIELQGVTDHGDLVAGKFTTFHELPRREFEPLWLVRQVHHEGEQPQVLEETSGGQASYHNQFVAVPWQVLFVPVWWSKRPDLPGYQTAIVTGPKGEEIYTDVYGRIKVQFHWDKEGQGDDKTSCWLRVAQGWVGDRYGSHWIPRVGQEVVVSFEHGNPDRPLVLGCVYNGANQHPYALPAHKTRTVFKTLSTPGGGGFNELRFEDKKGREQIFLHAQRDWELMVKANAYATIDGDSHRLTQGNVIERVKHDRSETVKKERFEELNADDRLKLKGTQQQQIEQSFMVSVADELHQNAAIKINMEAGAGLTLKVGGSFITLSPAGVQMVAPAISLNGGAAPLVGSDLSLLDVIKPIGAVVAAARSAKAATSKRCRKQK